MVATTSAAEDAGRAPSGLGSAALNPTATPRPLSRADAETYREIFLLQEAGDWLAADALIPRIEDPLLLGHVELARFTAATTTPPSFDQLESWLRRYADHPGAARLRALAEQRFPTAAVDLPRPTGSGSLGGWLVEAQERTEPIRADDPERHWPAGFAAWRAGRIEVAARHFETLARAEHAHPAERGRAAFWAARANLKLGRAGRFVPLLEIAAKRPRDFYGHLARAVLGRSTTFFFDPGFARGDAFARLRQEPGGRRALALAQIERLDLAKEEIQELARGADQELVTALIMLADALDLPATQVRLANGLAVEGHYLHGALYPVPTWQPWTGFSVDRALLLAIARAESGFDPDAESHVGAQGLMQLMPQTAEGIARIAALQPPAEGDLHEPETNLAFGQAYVEHLLNMRGIGDNLIFVLASYNAGPGRALHWQRTLGAADDPLLFLESIPTTETRVYIKTVLANLWTYRARLAQGQPSLGDLARGHWPVYVGLDRFPVADARL